jgi:mono/diheme cytochrome c family protein
VQQCGSCHRLADAGTQGVIAKDLDALKPTRQQVLAAIKDGPGNMPSNLVTGPYAQGVAAYVASVAGR